MLHLRYRGFFYEYCIAITLHIFMDMFDRLLYVIDIESNKAHTRYFLASVHVTLNPLIYALVTIHEFVNALV